MAAPQQQEQDDEDPDWRYQSFPIDYAQAKPFHLRTQEPSSNKLPIRLGNRDFFDDMNQLCSIDNF
jgi:hypothetical protein